MKLKDALMSKGIDPEGTMLERVYASKGERFIEVAQKMKALRVYEDETEVTKMIFSEPQKRKSRKGMQK